MPNKGQTKPHRGKSTTNGRQRKLNLQTQKGGQGAKKKQKRQTSESPEAETSSLYIKVLKVTPHQKAKWRPLPKSSRDHLESTMHWLIVSLLYKTKQNHDEIEKHLNLLKKRLLKSFDNLQVPVGKQSHLKDMRQLLAAERTKSVVMGKRSAELQDEIGKAVKAAESREEAIQCLWEDEQELKCELATEEAAASKLFHINDEDVLGLPDLPKDSLKAPILQDELLKVENQKGLLKDLNTIQQSHEMQAMLAFLEQAYETVDC